MKNMLGNNEVLRRMWRGPLLTLLERLNGENGEKWETELNEFLRIGEIWVGGNMQIPRRLEIVKPVPDGQTLSCNEFLTKAKKLAEKDGKRILGQEDYDRYKKKENWHLLPSSDSGIDTLVFCEAFFDLGDRSFVRSLSRYGTSKWHGLNHSIKSGFTDDCATAVSQIGPQN